MDFKFRLGTIAQIQWARGDNESCQWHLYHAVMTDKKTSVTKLELRGSEDREKNQERKISVRFLWRKQFLWYWLAFVLLLKQRCSVLSWRREPDKFGQRAPINTSRGEGNHLWRLGQGERWMQGFDCMYEAGFWNMKSICILFSLRQIHAINDAGPLPV